MDYLDLERFIHILLCIFTILLGISLALSCILYEENIRLAHAANVSGKVTYAFPQDTWFNISG